MDIFRRGHCKSEILEGSTYFRFRIRFYIFNSAKLFQSLGVTLIFTLLSLCFSPTCSGGSARSSAVGSVGSTSSGSRMSWTQLSSFMSSAHRNRMRISQQQVSHSRSGEGCSRVLKVVKETGGLTIDSAHFSGCFSGRFSVCFYPVELGKELH